MNIHVNDSRQLHTHTYVLWLGIVCMVACPPLLKTTSHSHENTHANDAIFYTPPGGDVSTPYDVSRDLFDDNFQ